VAFLLPFVWVFNPALLFEGSALAIAIVIVVTTVACMLIAKAIRVVQGPLRQRLPALGLFLVAIFGTMSCPVWLGSSSLWAFAVAAAGIALYRLWPEATRR
jgi:hypothetical protein